MNTSSTFLCNDLGCKCTKTRIKRMGIATSMYWWWRCRHSFVLICIVNNLLDLFVIFRPILLMKKVMEKVLKAYEGCVGHCASHEVHPSVKILIPAAWRDQNAKRRRQCWKKGVLHYNYRQCKNVWFVIPLLSLNKLNNTSSVCDVWVAYVTGLTLNLHSDLYLC